MKKIHHLCLAALMLLCLVGPLAAREFLEHGALIEAAQSIDLNQYPDADDVLIDDYIQVRYQEDGSSENWDDSAVKILTEKGKRDQRTLSLRYDTAYGTSRFTKVEIIKPDGSVIPVDIESQSKEMVDPGQMSANIYNPNSKVLQLSVPGLEVGDILRYVIHRVRTKTVVPDTWSDYMVFEHTSPMERTTYEVIAPKSMPIRKSIIKDEIPGTISAEKREMEDSIIYTWKVKDVPRMFDEPNMPTRYTVTQRLLVSTMEDWRDLSRWYWELCKPRLDSTTPEMEAKAKELVKDCTTTQEKIEAMFRFVSQQIRYMGITTEEEAPGYEPHDVHITFENRYGVCRDKGALLASMLRLVGVDAFPVIIMAGPKKDEEVPQPFFNHAVTAALADDGSYVLMDPTDESTRDIFPSYLQDKSYLVARPEGETLLTSPVIPATDNLLRIRTEGTLSDKGTLEAESTLLFEGINDTVYRGYFSKIKPEERRRFFEGHIKSSMPTAELRELTILPQELRDTTHPLEIRMSFTAANLMIGSGTKKMLNLPKLSASLGYANFLLGQTGLEKRQYPLYTRMTAGIEETLTLQLPLNNGDIEMPEFTEIDNERMHWSRTVSRKSATLKSASSLQLKTVEFSPEEYLILKENLKEIEYNNRKKLILDMPSADMPDARPLSHDKKSTLDMRAEIPDTRILSRDCTIELESPSKWTETIQVRQQILTYAGKKKFSEIKLNYNPTWQTIELTKASVTAPDGTVKEIGAEELNLMDAPWVASAPRYPAEKILVANLPAVEVGSIIDYKIVSKAAGKPFFSTRRRFNDLEPIERETLTLIVPDQLKLQLENSGITPTRETRDGKIIHRWSAANSPALKKEENMPAWWTYNPSVFISTAEWPDYSDALLKELRAASKNQPDTEKLARELVQDTEDASSQIRILRDWTAENLRPAGPPLTALPFEAITPADRTLSERYGNGTDRAVVLYTLLKAAGFKPDYVLAAKQSLIPEASTPQLATPQRGFFSNLLVRVKTEGRTLYLTGTSQYAEPGTSPFEDQPLLDLKSGKIYPLNVPAGLESRSKASWTLQVATDGSTRMIRNKMMLGNAYEGFNRMFSEITPEKRRRLYLEMIASVSQSAKAESELTTDHKSYPGKQAFTITADRYAVQDGDYLYFTIPNALRNLLRYRSNERTAPLAWDRPVRTETEYILQLPPNMQPDIFPQNYHWEAPNKAGYVSVEVDYDRAINTIFILQKAELKPALVPPEAYSGIIEAGRILAHPDMNTVLLKRKD